NTACKGDTGQAVSSEVLHEIGHHCRFQPTTYRSRRRMEDSIPHEIWIVRVSSDAFWAHKWTCIFPALHQRRVTGVPRYFLHSIHRRHTDIQRYLEGTQEARATSARTTQKVRLTGRHRQMRVS